MNSFVEWLVKSSKDPAKTALTLKGILVTFLPLVVVALKFFGLEIVDPNALAGQIESFLVLFFGAVGSVMALIGLARKIALSFVRK